MCKKLGSILHNMTKVDITCLEEWMTTKQVNHRRFDASEIAKEMPFPAQMLQLDWGTSQFQQATGNATHLQHPHETNQ